MAEKFLIDDQTLRDIQLRDLRNFSVFNYFDRTVTDGGQELLRALFYSPSLDVKEVRARQLNIRRLEPVANEPFEFYRVILTDIEKYIKSMYTGIKSSVGLMDIFGVKSPFFYYKKRSIMEISDFLIKSQEFYKKVNAVQHYEDIAEMIDSIEECLSAIFKNKKYDTEKLKLNIFNIEKYDGLLRRDLVTKIRRAIEFFYEIDAYFSVARVSAAKGFCYPEVFEKNETRAIHMEGVYHIFLREPVANDIHLHQEKKIWFLTGANMAGKSSIIKSISTAVYLTQIGFPVPATSVKMDLLDGLFTSINLQDNLELGYSHFYVEAMRLKTIVDHLGPDSNALIILDELFKGTNHSDASHAILKVVENLAEADGPYVIISSHITELSEELKHFPLVDFFKMNIANDEDGHPIFTYKIIHGIAQEKLGMWLLKKSGAFEAIDKLKK